MDDKLCYIQLEGLNNTFIFNDESLKIFNEEFFCNEKDLKVCPYCNVGEDIHNYLDYFVCFKCKKNYKYKRNFHLFKLSTINGYLCRINIKTKKEEFFHRYLMKDEIKKFKEKNLVGDELIHVHHKNENINYNTKKNLDVMTEAQHQSLHKTIGKNRAYVTWCEKVYGEYGCEPESAYDKFLEWKEKKEGEIW